ncbi:hypothetical protein SAMN04488104_100112 [Algoriphagus faecimaris]|uniref:Lipoprotein n=1 Tax=Algoriphagus faecimaris TaxID=686796 RepID=A0A1G6M4Q0_9BACT|nr:hypothetical protein SAMN04488104_100112 [Algoriphagus faecimaris]
MKNKFLNILYFLLLSLILTSCEAYIRFENFRTKIIVIIFIITFIIGGVGLLFQKKR